MSGDRLNPDQVAALVEAAKQGQLPEQPSGSGRRGHRLRTVDFSRPTKFTSDHQRRISRAIDTFCQTSVTRLSTELRTADRARGDQHDAGHVVGRAVPAAGRFAVRRPSTCSRSGPRCCSRVEQSFVLMCLDLLLGGSPDKPPRERRFSEIDTVLTQRLFESLDPPAVARVAGPGRDHAVDRRHRDPQRHEPDRRGVGADLRGRDREPDQQALGLDGAAGSVARDRLGRRAPDPARRRASRRPNRPAPPRSAGPWRRSRSRCAPRSPRSSLPIDEILALGPGSVDPARRVQADQGVTVFAENVKLARAQPGCNGPRRADPGVRHRKEVRMTASRTSPRAKR